MQRPVRAINFACGRNRAKGKKKRKKERKKGKEKEQIHQ